MRGQPANTNEEGLAAHEIASYAPPTLRHIVAPAIRAIVVAATAAGILRLLCVKGSSPASLSMNVVRGRSTDGNDDGVRPARDHSRLNRIVSLRYIPPSESDAITFRGEARYDGQAAQKYVHKRLADDIVKLLTTSGQKFEGEERAYTLENLAADHS